MSIQKVQGLQLAIAATFGTSKNMSACTNANPGAMTLETASGIADGDVMVVTSGWPRLNGRVIRATSVSTGTTDSASLEGVNTTDTDLYPAGEGVGSVLEVATWVNLDQLRPDFSVGGGGFTQDNITQMTDVRNVNRPGLAEAVNLDFSCFWDPSLSWVDYVRSASEGAVLTPYRMTTAAGSKIYGNAYWGFLEEPVPDSNSFIYRLTLGLAAQSIAYST